MPNRILLNMIMKNESSAGVLLRGFETIRHIFHAYCISDTGSTDDSIEVTKRWMKEHDKPGQVTVDPWQDDFGLHRTLALEHAYKTIRDLDPFGEYTWYAMFHDADNEACSDEKGERFPWNRTVLKSLKSKRIDVNMRSNSQNLYRYTWMVCLGKSYETHPWRWLCSRHEYVDDCNSGNFKDCQTISGGYIHSGRDGARGKTSMPKYMGDAVAIENELKRKTESPRPRLVYYLANSYKDCRWWDRAAFWYQRRTEMGSFMEEVFWSYVHLHDMLRLMKQTEKDFLRPLTTAMVLFPHRLEAAHRYMSYMIDQGRFAEAWIASRPFLHLPDPDVLLWKETPLYQGEFDFKALLACYYAGTYKINRGVLENPNVALDDPSYKEGIQIAGMKTNRAYRAIVQHLLSNPLFKDKSPLEERIRNTAGIWSEEEKAVLYRIIESQK